VVRQQSAQFTEARTLIVAGCTLILFVAAGILATVSLLGKSFSTQRDIRVAQVLNAQVLLLQIDEQNAARGYALTNTRVLLEPYYSANRRFDDRVAELAQAGHKIGIEIDPILDDIRQRNREWRRSFVEPSLRNHQKGSDSLERSLTVKALIDGSRLDVEEINDIIEQRSAEIDHSTEVTFTLTVAACLAGAILTSALLLWVLGRQNRLHDELARQRRTADLFQGAALPAALPELPGFSFDTMYVPAAIEDPVGGDWYDALQLNDGRIVISIGDVAGNGLKAAVTMAAIRQGIRTVAEIHANPIAMLEAVDRSLRSEQPDQMATAFVGVLDPIELTLFYASAGHPAAILRQPGGEVRAIGCADLPLGIRTYGEGEVENVDLPPGSFILFHTDGLIEARRDLIGAERQLHALVGDEAVRNAVRPARTIYQAMLGTSHTKVGEEARDDIAILTLKIALDVSAQSDALHRWSFDSSDAEAAARARGEFVAALAAARVVADDLFSAELVFGELLGNVVRYAPGALEIVFDWRAPRAVLHVLDRGPGFALVPRLPTELFSERGRGLFLVSSLSEDFNASRRAKGVGTHARAVLSLRRHPRRVRRQPDDETATPAAPEGTAGDGTPDESLRQETAASRGG
jgi:serine phosphatase RsbU (regulator of sigma subunit)/anti-sigma regulatory factor (Ser/Thr protein kinase)